MKKHLLLQYIAGLLILASIDGSLMAQSVALPETLKEDSTHYKPSHQLGLDVRSGYVAPNHRFFEGENLSQKHINQSLSVHLKYAFRFDKNSTLGRMYPHAYQGIGVSYNTFFAASEMGNPVAVYAFQGSRIAQLSPRISLDYEWNFGASFGWKKYDEIDNPYNEVMGSDINAYINLGFFLNWRLNPQWNLTAGLDFTHCSNGNTHHPNVGVNLIGGRIGVVRTLGKDEEAAGKRPHPLSVSPSISYDVVVYGTTRKRAFLDEHVAYVVPGSFGIIGLNFNPMYRFNNYFKVGVSLDVQYDESANIKEYRVEGTTADNVKFHRPPFHKQFSTGLSLRGELVMPIFSVNAGIGHNLINSGEDTKGFYQVLALKTSLTRNLFLHVGYQLHDFKNPNNLMLGFGYRFHGKR